MGNKRLLIGTEVKEKEAILFAGEPRAVVVAVFLGEDKKLRYVVWRPTCDTLTESYRVYKRKELETYATN